METLQSLYVKSNSFYKPGYCNHWITEKKPKTLQNLFLENANKSYVFTDFRVSEIMNEFLFFKKNTVSPDDSSLNIYKNMNLEDFIQRLITKRPLSFYGHTDKFFYVKDESLKQSVSSSNSFAGSVTKPFFTKYFGELGNSVPEKNLEFPEFLSNEEIKFCSYLQFSSPVTPLNDGMSPNNNKPSVHINNAICIGTPYIRLDVADKYNFDIVDIRH